MSVPAQATRPISPAFGPAIAIGLGLAILGSRAIILLFDHSLHSIDGVLQTWFALENFSQGNQLGTDFQSYLGITMILALLPAYLGLGGTLYASTVSATAAVVIGAFGSAYFVAWQIRAIAPRHRWLAAIALVFVFYYALGIPAALMGYPYPLSFDPGVSLRAVRGFLPFFVAPAFVFCLRAALRDASAWPGFYLGLVGGVGLLWSNDAGIPLVIAMVIGLVAGLLQRRSLLFKTLFTFGAGAALSAIALLLIVTHAEPGPWLTYNFRDVASDQTWYFGPWDRSTRIFAPADLRFILFHGEPLSLIALLLLTAAVALLALKRLRGKGSPVRDAAFIFVGASTIGTALLPQIGGHVAGSYNHTAFFLGAMAPFILTQSWPAPMAKSILNALPKFAPIAAVSFATILIILVEGLGMTNLVKSSPRTVFAPELGFYVTPEYSEDLRAMARLSDHWDREDIPQKRRLLSVYTSALDIAADAKSPTPVGSLIHALGQENRHNFPILVISREVEAVTTILPDYSGWEGWNRRTDWRFFHALRTNYLPLARNDQHVLWVRSRSSNEPQKPASCTVTKRSQSSLEITVQSDATGVASINLQRSGKWASNRSSILTVTETSPFTNHSISDIWEDFPRYGAPNEAKLMLGVPVESDAPSNLLIEMLDGSMIGEAQCSASVLRPIDYAVLPSIPDGVGSYIRKGQAHE